MRFNWRTFGCYLAASATVCALFAAILAIAHFVGIVAMWVSLAVLMVGIYAVLSIEKAAPTPSARRETPGGKNSTLTGDN